jgi:hypothetical protein
MFYQSVEAAYRAGEVTIGLPAVGQGDKVYVEAKGLIGWQAKFLSKAERRMLANYSIAEVAARSQRHHSTNQYKALH